MRPRRRRLAATAALITLATAGCSLTGAQETGTEASPTPQATIEVGTQSAPAGEPGASTGTGQPQDQDQADEAQARKDAQIEFAREVTEVMLTWNPGQDLNRTSGVLQAREFMIPQRAERVGAPKRPASGQLWRWADNTGAVAYPIVYVPSQSFDSPGQDLPGAATPVKLVADVYWYPDGDKASPDRRFDSTYELYFTITNDEPYRVVDFTMETTNWGEGR